MPENGAVDSDDVSRRATRGSDRHDPLQDTTTALISAARTSAQGPTELLFARKLMNMINDGRFRGVLGWSADGASFSILKRDDFKRRVLPAYFGSIQVKSFKKRLSRHGFETRQVYTLGREDTVFFHPNFQRDKPELCVKIVPLGTSRPTKKRSRAEVEDQPSDRPSSSFPHSPSAGAKSIKENRQPLDQSPSHPPLPLLPTVFPTPDSIEERPARTSSPEEDVKVASTVLLDVLQKTIAISDDRACSAPSTKKMRSNSATHDNRATQDMSMRVQLGGNTSDSLSNEACDTEQENDGSTTNQHEPETHTPAPRENGALGTVTFPKVLSYSPGTASQAAQPSCEDECSSMPHSAGDSCTKKESDPKNVSPTISRDNGTQTATWKGRSQEEGATGCIEQQANGGIYLSDNDAGRSDEPSSGAQCVLQQELTKEEHGKSPFSSNHSSSIGLNSSFRHSIQQQWLQSELQAAAMSAHAAFLRNLYVQLCGNHGTLNSLGGAFASPSQPGSMGILQQQLQVALGSIGRDGCGVAQHDTQIGGPRGALPENPQQNLSVHPPQTTSAQGTRTGRLLSSAQDPVAVILEMASSPGQKFSS